MSLQAEWVLKLKPKLDLLESKIQQACNDAKRPRAELSLLAVSKTQPPEAIRAAYELGLRDFGENYAQELSEKQTLLADLKDIRWHFIGHLQTNKVKSIWPQLHTLHTIDRVSLLDFLVNKAPTLGRLENKVKVLVQLAVDPEDAQKTSLDPNLEQEVCARLAQAHKNGLLFWQGFMGIGAADRSAQQTLVDFKNWSLRARLLWKDLAPDNTTPPLLSLGMSGDLDEAVAAGSGMVRVGSALFGEREKLRTSAPLES